MLNLFGIGETDTSVSNEDSVRLKALIEVNKILYDLAMNEESQNHLKKPLVYED